MNKRRFALSVALAASFFGVSSKADAVIKVWASGTTNLSDPAIATTGAIPNWTDANGVAVAAPTIADEARFTSQGSTNVNVASNWSAATINFSGINPSNPIVGVDTPTGVIPNYTFTGPGKITVASWIDTDAAQTGTVTFSNTGGIDITGRSRLYAASATGNSDLIISAITPLRLGLPGGSSGGTILLEADGGNLIINSAVDLTGSTSARSIGMNANLGKTINLAGGITCNAGNTNLANVTLTGTGGKVILPSVNAGWTGNMNIATAAANLSSLEISSSTSLGAVGASASGFTQVGASSTQVTSGSLNLNKVGGSFSVNEFMLLYGRSTGSAHISNAAGVNTITAGGGAKILSNAGAGDIRIESNGVIGTDSLEIQTDIELSSVAAGNKRLVLGGTSDGTMSGNIVTSGGAVLNEFEKVGGGTWIISGTNNYTGNTTVSNGTLSLGSSGSIANSAAINVKNGAALNVSGLAGGGLTLGSAQTLSGNGTVTGGITTVAGTKIAPGNGGTAAIGTLTINGATTLADSTLQFQLTSNTAGTNDKIFSNNTISATGTNTIEVTMSNGVLGSGSYRLLDYTGAALNIANFNVTGIVLSPRQSSFGLSSVANQLNLNVVGGPATLTWVGGMNANAWDVGSTVNWTGATGPAFDNHFYDGDNVIFNTTGTNTVALGTTVSPGTASFTNPTGQNYTLTGFGTFAVSGDLTSSGAGGNVTFTHAVTTVGGNVTTSGSGTVLVSNGNFSVAGSFNSAGAKNVTFSNADLSLAGTLTQNGTGTVTIGNTGLLTLPSAIAINSGKVSLARTDGDDTTPLIVASNLTGAGTFRKDGSNYVLLNGNNSGFIGMTEVVNGTLRTNGNDALTKSVVSDGATLDIQNNGGTVNGGGTKTVTITGSGVGGLGSLITTNGDGNSAAHVGQLILSGNSKIAAIGRASGPSFLDFDGPITGNGFDLEIVVDNSIAAGTQVDFVNSGVANLHNISVGGGGRFFIGGNTDFGTTGSLILTDHGRLTLHATGSVDSIVQLNKPITVANSANGGAIQAYRGSKTVGSPITNNSNLDLTVTNISSSTTVTLTMTGAISDGETPGSLSVHLAETTNATRLGMIELTSNNNTYTGITKIGGGGGLSAVSANSDRITLSVGNGGTTGSLGSGEVVLGNGSGATPTLQFNRVAAYTVGNVISGTGNVTAIAPGAVVTLSNNSTYIGNTTVSAGTLDITGTHTGGVNYNVATGANLIATNVRVTNALTVDGTATINANGGTVGASKVETLTINAGGKLNLKDNDLVVGTAANVTAVRDQIKLGKTNNAPSGITSDAALFGSKTGFGYAMGDDPNLSPLLTNSSLLTGQSFDTDSVLVKYTFLGDADLDGDTDLNDLGKWASNFTGDLNNPAVPAKFWTQGDFDYDGDTDLNDLGKWSSNFTGDLNGGAGSLIVYAPGASASAVSVLNGMGITVVPEPSTYLMAACGLVGLGFIRKSRTKVA